MMWNFGEWWHMGAGFGFHWVFMIGFWSLLFFAAVMMIRAVTGGAGIADRSNRPLGILKERYASGDITHDEYDAMAENLRGH